MACKIQCCHNRQVAYILTIPINHLHGMQVAAGSVGLNTPQHPNMMAAMAAIPNMHGQQVKGVPFLITPQQAAAVGISAGLGTLDIALSLLRQHFAHRFVAAGVQHSGITAAQAAALSSVATQPGGMDTQLHLTKECFDPIVVHRRQGRMQLRLTIDLQRRRRRPNASKCATCPAAAGSDGTAVSS